MGETFIRSLAVWRLTNMITDEEGPFEVFRRLRTLLGGDSQTTWVGRGVVCHWCVSVWVSWALNRDRPIRERLAISALSIIIDLILRRLR